MAAVVSSSILLVLVLLLMMIAARMVVPSSTSVLLVVGARSVIPPTIVAVVVVAAAIAVVVVVIIVTTPTTTAPGKVAQVHAIHIGRHAGNARVFRQSRDRTHRGERGSRRRLRGLLGWVRCLRRVLFLVLLLLVSLLEALMETTAATAAAKTTRTMLPRTTRLQFFHTPHGGKVRGQLLIRTIPRPKTSRVIIGTGGEDMSERMEFHRPNVSFVRRVDATDRSGRVHHPIVDGSLRATTHKEFLVERVPQDGCRMMYHTMILLLFSLIELTIDFLAMGFVCGKFLHGANIKNLDELIARASQ